MKRILILMVMVFASASCFALGFVDPDAPKKDPEWTRAVRKGAKAKLELHVVDDEGNPVPDVNVNAVMWMVTDAYTLNGQTDTNGTIGGVFLGNNFLKYNYNSAWNKTTVDVYGYEGINVVGIDF